MKSFAVYGRMGHATDKQRQYEFVSVSMLRLTDGHLVGRSFMEYWDRERGGGREEKFGDLICRFTRLPWPHVSRRSRLHTRPAGEVSMSGGESLKQTVSKCNGYAAKVFLINNPCHPNFPAMQSPLICKTRPSSMHEWCKDLPTLRWSFDFRAVAGSTNRSCRR